MKPANYAPVYAGLYPELAEIARKHGYAMAVHGSLARDADLICIPWTNDAATSQAVVDAITREFVIRSVGEPNQREHGRVVYTLTVAAPGCFIDLSFTPLSLSPAPAVDEMALRAAWENGRTSWCPAGILGDTDRTERDWQRARSEILAALSEKTERK